MLHSVSVTAGDTQQVRAGGITLTFKRCTCLKGLARGTCRQLVASLPALNAPKCLPVRHWSPALSQHGYTDALLLTRLTTSAMASTAPIYAPIYAAVAICGFVSSSVMALVSSLKSECAF